MAFQYRVTKVHGSDQWTSNYGPMIGWKLQVDNLSTGASQFVEINSKVGSRPYEVGNTFYADVVGERAGVPKLKRANPPPDQGAPSQPSVAPAQAPLPMQQQAARGPAPTARGVGFDLALEVLMTCAAHVDQHAPMWATPESRASWATALFISWQRGDVQRPTPVPIGMGAPGDDYPPPEGDDIPF